MSKNYAIVVQKPGEAAKDEVPVPKLRDDYILVKVAAVALNPTDWKHIDFLTSKGCHVSYLCSLTACF
jgi:NADPH:quinone reductase-like Zn-dependent oxidoreductase